MVIDATYNEVILLPIEEHPHLYDYSDVADFGTVTVRAYSLEEIATEKLRGLLFQRVHPSPRDLSACNAQAGAYDLWYLWAHGSVDWDQVVQVFPQKCAGRGISIEAPLSEILHAREVAVRGVWEGTLSGLIGHYPPFEEAWNLIDQLVDKLSRAR